MTSGEFRDWQPGDGLVCHLAKASPIPCGRPVKTQTVYASSTLFEGERPRKYVKCALHAAVHVSGATVGALVATAKKQAHERLAHEHWDEFEKFRAEILDHLIADAMKREVS